MTIFTSFGHLFSSETAKYGSSVFTLVLKLPTVSLANQSFLYSYLVLMAKHCSFFVIKPIPVIIYFQIEIGFKLLEKKLNLFQKDLIVWKKMNCILIYASKSLNLIEQPQL